jgi:hypothetical protein
VLAHKVDEIIRKQTGLSGATFEQLYDHTGILLKIFATSLRSGELIEFSALRTPYDQVSLTPPYVSIRQHSSAYVSMRQHSSAYICTCVCARLAPSALLDDTLHTPRSSGTLLCAWNSQ